MCLYIEGRSISNIVRRTPTANSILVYAQTAVKHKEYFYYVFSFFSSFCVKDYIPQSKIVRDNRTKKIYSAISFTTMQLPCFNEFQEIFYNLISEFFLSKLIQICKCNIEEKRLFSVKKYHIKQFCA